MTVQRNQPLGGDETFQAVLNRRLEVIGWALFLIMIGGIGLVPSYQVPEGTWLVGTGLIMLGLNVARYVQHVPLHGVTITLGILALFLGGSDFFGVKLPFFPILLILIGANLLLRPLFERGEAGGRSYPEQRPSP